MSYSKAPQQNHGQRQQQQQPPSATILKYMYNPVPLFIRDILKIKIDRTGPYIKCSIFGLSFRSVVLYGRAFPWGAHSMYKTNEDIRIYKIDDGTESILVHYAHNPNQLKDVDNQIGQLELEINSAHKSLEQPEQPLNYGNELMLKNDEKENTLDAVNVMMTRIKTTTNGRKKYFNNGENVFIIGRPSKCRLGDRLVDSDNNKLHLFADTMLEDNKLDNSFEINFKLNLARLYEQNYKNSI